MRQMNGRQGHKGLARGFNDLLAADAIIYREIHYLFRDRRIRPSPSSLLLLLLLLLFNLETFFGLKSRSTLKKRPSKVVTKVR